MELDLENPLASADDDEQQRRRASVSALFAAELDHSIASTIDIAVRRDAVSLIVQAQFTCNDADPFLTYLAVNYVDRFLSKRQIPREKPRIVRLLSVSCLSLASKMTETHFPLSHFQGEEGSPFDSRTIFRMEMLILGALDWRMRSITPFSFLRFFVTFFSPTHPSLLRALRSRASLTILRAQDEIKMMEFKPSVIAAAALLSAANVLFPSQFPAFRSAISSCEFINREELCACFDAMDGCDSTREVGSIYDARPPVLESRERTRRRILIGRPGYQAEPDLCPPFLKI
ncbi:unnamed protein product [Musa acuminata subsp. burmannicoides]